MNFFVKETKVLHLKLQKTNHEIDLKVFKEAIKI